VAIDFTLPPEVLEARDRIPQGPRGHAEARGADEVHLSRIAGCVIDAVRETGTVRRATGGEGLS
jgi:hypothetical protein